MGLIYGYPNDTRVQDDDAWIGTNAENRKTVQFTAQKVADYLNINGKISIANQYGFRFLITESTAKATMFFTGGGGDETNFSDITSIVVSSYDISNQYMPNFFAILVGSQILISHKDDVNSFGHYTVQGYSATANPNFYTLDLLPLSGNNTILNAQYYYLSSLNLASGSSGDKNFIYNQGTPSATWNITHALDKYPSVSVVDSAGTVWYPSATYNSLTSITLEFSAAFSGKAYLN